MSLDSVRVLVVDDDPLQLDLVQRGLRSFGFEVMVSASAIGVSNSIRSFGPHVVLIDVEIPALSGDRLLVLARKNAPAGTRFILYSAVDESTLRRLAMEAGADGWISKSTTGSELASRLRTIARPADSRRVP
jgi:DNA-binding response OmpR family regulator